MRSPDSDATMAVFLDLENIALGAHDAQFPAFDINKVIERLLLKGHIVVKKAYCDFERYKSFRRGLHEAAFELIQQVHPLAQTIGAHLHVQVANVTARVDHERGVAHAQEARAVAARADRHERRDVDFGNIPLYHELLSQFSLSLIFTPTLHI